jgi:hypothetical protein
MNKIYVILLILIVAIIYLYSENKCVKESMANTEENLDEKIKNHVSNIYKADIKAIQNLANISTELQNGSLKIPGNLTIDGDLVVNKNSNVKGQTTINALYGGKSTHGGWRDIIVNGGHLRFVVGQNTVDYCVVGFEKLEQLEDVYAASASINQFDYSDFFIEDDGLINPRNWNFSE